MRDLICISALVVSIAAIPLAANAKAGFLPGDAQREATAGGKSFDVLRAERKQRALERQQRLEERRKRRAKTRKSQGG